MPGDNIWLLPNHSRGAEGESTSEIPAKRKRKSDKYEAFEPEEKMQLKNYDTWESQARKILNETYGKLFKDLPGDDTQTEISYLKKRLRILKNKASLDPICIGILGQTGAGKTSLLNAILGKKLFLPVSDSSVCTSCVVKVTPSSVDQSEATVHFLSDTEWKEEMKKLVEVLSKNGDDEDDHSGDGDSDKCVEDATEKLCALYGPGAEEKDFEALSKTKMLVEVPTSRKKTIKEKEVEDFPTELGRYIRVPDDNKHGLWPLIKYVEVTIPGSDILPEGIVFFDIPGTGDFNSKRDEMWKQSIHECGVLWVISDIVRVQGESTQEELLKASIKACVGGTCTDIALVVTKTDKLDLDNYRSEGKSKGKQCLAKNKHDAILERNQDVKKKKERSIKEQLKKRLPSDSEILNKSKLVYTVSAKLFWKQTHLSQEETEIPALRKNIREIYLKEKQKLVTDYVNDVRSIGRLAKNFVSEPQPEDLLFHESGVERDIMIQVDSLVMDLERRFGETENPLFQGVDHARRNYRTTLENLLRRDKDPRGFHKTLKAVCLKDGVYASKSFSRINLNESLAELIHSKTDDIFYSIFRTRNPTRSSLWPCLEMFKDTVQDMILKTGKDSHLLNNNKIDIFLQETNIILKQVKKEILQRKLGIYESLSESIQSDLKSHYEEASEIKGRGAYVRMQTILSEGIENEVTNGMFERAKSRMQSEFEELKKYIVLKLKEDISIAFNLVFLQEGRTAVHLPDIGQECNKIDEIYEKLQNDS